MNSLDINLDRVLLMLFMSIRFGAFFLTMPIFADLRLGMLLHVIIPVGMAGLLAPVMPLPVWGAMSSNAGILLLVIVNEFMIGAILGFSVRILFSLAQFAGEFAGIQIGFSMANVYDPSFGQISSLSQFVGIFIILAFFVLDTHHVMIKTLAESYRTLVPGVFFQNYHEVALSMSKMMSALFSFGCRFALPVAAAILISHLLNGLISVTAPQLNIYFNAGIALNIGIGLLIMAVSFSALIKFYQRGQGLLHDFILQIYGIAW